MLTCFICKWRARNKQRCCHSHTAVREWLTGFEFQLKLHFYNLYSNRTRRTKKNAFSFILFIIFFFVAIQIKTPVKRNSASLIPLGVTDWILNLPARACWVGIRRRWWRSGTAASTVWTPTAESRASSRPVTSQQVPAVQIHNYSYL